MAYDTRVLNVLIASPGDVRKERDAIEDEVALWNRQHRHAVPRVMLEVLRWEKDSIPELGEGDAQSVINTQVVDQADIVIGVLHSRLGTPTGRAESGTVEELHRLSAAGKPVHLYVSKKPLPHDHDPMQFQAVKRFCGSLSGLLAEFTSRKELREKVRNALSRDVSSIPASSESIVRAWRPEPPQSHALAARQATTGDSVRSFTRRESVFGQAVLEVRLMEKASSFAPVASRDWRSVAHIHVRNVGDVTAEGIKVSEHLRIALYDDGKDILPGEDHHFLKWGEAPEAPMTLVLNWTERGRARNAKYRISRPSEEFMSAR